MNNLTQTAIKPEKINYLEKPLEQPSFLEQIVENFEDGILILTETGELIYANASAYSICSQINPGSSNRNYVPSIIWNVCKSLINNQMSCDNLTIWSEDIVVNRSVILRLRVRWLNHVSEQSYLSIAIENRYKSLKNIVLFEANKYHLTQREVEVWNLYRATSSYKHIADKLYITVNTVKKHLKNIRAKQQRFYSA